MTLVTLLIAALMGTLPAAVPADSTMRKEADAFIAGMDTRLQPRQRDAIRAAIDGDTRALQQVRNARNARPVYPPCVEVTEPAPHLRLYTPTGAAAADRPLLVYLHGGGWTIGSLNSCARFCGEVCARGSVSVLAVDYRLAPEHPYPAGLDDCERAVRFALEHAAAWGCSPRRVIVGGDSSGGNLAIATALRLDKGDVVGLLLFYPVVKAWNDGSPSWQAYGKGFGLDGDLMEAFNRSYVTPDGARKAGVSPMLASDEALRTLPRTLLVAAGRDILACQGAEFIDRITALGVEAERIEFAPAVHLFITVPGQDTAFNEAVARAVGFMNK